MSRIVDIEPLLKKYDGMNDGTEFSPIHFINDLMTLEQQPSDSNITDPCDGCRYELNSTNGNPCYSCGKYKLTEQQPNEDTEVIKVSKGTVKARQGRFVIYDVFWLKENFYTTEEKIYGQPTQPCEDCISRQAVIILIDEASEMYPYKVVGDSDTYSNYNQGWSDACDWLYANIDGIPSVTPQASEEDFHREREQAYMLGYEDASKKFRTEPCEDAVSRQDVDAYIAKLMSGYLYDEERTRLEEFSAYLWELPPVTPRTNLAETSQDCISILNRIMEYTYGMLTSEKYGLQHLIKSMMDELSGGDSE